MILLVGLDFHELEPLEFEEMVAKLLVKLGYHNVRNRRGANDGGIDVEATNTSVISTNRIAIQCKRYADNKVRLHHIRNIDSAVRNENFTTGVVVTSGTFTKDAIEYAKKSSVKIQLIDGNKLRMLVNSAFPRITSIRDILRMDSLSDHSKTHEGSSEAVEQDNLESSSQSIPDPLSEVDIAQRQTLDRAEQSRSPVSIEGTPVQIVNQRQISNLKLSIIDEKCTNCGLHLRGLRKYCVKCDWYFGSSENSSDTNTCKYHPTVKLRDNYCHKCDWTHPV